MEKTIVLTMEDKKRVEVMERVFRKELRMAEAALVLGVTERHSYRIKARISVSDRTIFDKVVLCDESGFAISAIGNADLR